MPQAPRTGLSVRDQVGPRSEVIQECQVIIETIYLEKLSVHAHVQAVISMAVIAACFGETMVDL